jgi:hypothetical protein
VPGVHRTGEFAEGPDGQAGREADRKEWFDPPPSARGRPAIGQFYDADERRRGPDLRLGDEWTTAADPGCLQVVFWILGTGELVAKRAPANRAYVYGDRTPIVGAGPPAPESPLTVEVFGVISKSDPDDLAASYGEIMPMPTSLDILRASLGQGTGSS